MMSYWVVTASVLAVLFALAVLIRRTNNTILLGLLVSATFTVFLLWLFYENFGVINLSIFCVAFFFDCIFISLGLWRYAQDRKSRDESDKASNLRGDWLAIITLVGFLFHYAGPVVGWGLTDLSTEASWPLLYGTRVILALILPTISAAVMLPFLLRRALLVYVPLVLLMTALPVWSGLNAALDLYEGPRFQIIRHGCYSDADVWAKVESCFCGGKEVFCDRAQKDEEVFLLPHTRRALRATGSNILAVPGARAELQIGTK